MKINKDIKNGLFVKDIKRLIDGYIIRTFNEINNEDFKIHVEFKRFKGDEDPFVIEYTKNEIIKDIFPLYSNNVKSNYFSFFLTIGRLKENLKRSKLPDDRLIMIEQPNNIDKEHIYKTKDIIKDGIPLDFSREYIHTCACGENSKDLKFFINYNF